jgi:catechol 2,3-dioxygenase-like lactoylglutathione lyase family enzyme
MELRRAIIFVKDLEKMATFYRDGLGLRPIRERSQPGWLELQAGPGLLALHAIPPSIADAIEITLPPAARDEGAIKLVFEAPDLAAARDHLTAHGALMGQPHAWGACDGTDPEDNVFQIVETGSI